MTRKNSANPCRSEDKTARGSQPEPDGAQLPPSLLTRIFSIMSYGSFALDWTLELAHGYQRRLEEAGHAEANLWLVREFLGSVLPSLALRMLPLLRSITNKIQRRRRP